MLDIKYIEENKEYIKEVCEKREVEDNVEELLNTYQQLRKLQFELDTLKHTKNTKTQHINELKKQNKNTKKHIVELKDITTKIKEKEQEYKIIEQRYEELMYTIPNILDKRVPLGDVDREEFRAGNFKNFDFQPLTNWE